VTPRTETLSTQLLLGRARQKQLKLLSVFLFLLLVLGFFGVVLGPASIQWRALFDTVSGVTSHSVDHTVIFQLRMPRVLLAIVAGGALACSGAALQSLFNNPLAEPGLIGISSGAMIFVILGILLMPLLPVLGPVLSEHYIWTLPVLGFVGAMGLGVLVYRLSSLNGRVDVTTMLLAGIAANAFAGAIAGLLIFVSNDEQLRTITFWTMGSLGGATWGMVIP
jgi:iron complex transport system permease protein